MNTQFAQSPDGTQIAYDCCGTGPAIVLIHGGGGNRQEWYAAGYNKRLQNHFTVIALDLRGHGESDHPTDTIAYTPDKMGQDILTVVDACGVERFAIWGMSYGGKVSRYLVVTSERMTKFIMMGTPMGLGVSGERRQQALDFCAHWPPILQTQRDGTLDLNTLSPNDQNLLNHFNIPVMLAWVTAMLDWPTIEPADFLCPTLWLIGSQDHYAMTTLEEYAESIEQSKVQVHIIQGLDHNQVFDEIDTVFPTMLDFTLAQ